MRRRWKGLLVLIILLLTTTIVALLIHYGRSSVTGVIENTAPTPTVSPVNDAKKLESSYFSLDYPATYNAVSSDKSVSGLLEYHILASQQATSGQQVGISIAKLPEGGITETANYKLYSLKPSQYSISESTYNKETVYVANRTDDAAEQTALWAHAGNYVAITMTAPAGATISKTEFSLLLAGFTWR